ncbi:hypothetical protein chiPu_0019672 [Chiloscyllium punctatum]|uniref:Uncharacterized protein n=1 Tax=Chiloscyllium punctatum TaxID=137246 RepID=A0A401RSS9_CHIPU|nr:hypothetical protein [Chiloscyllium punctatum]
MEQQYTQFLQDLQEDAYSSQFLTYNRIDYEFGPSGSEKVQEQYPNPQCDAPKPRDQHRPATGPKEDGLLQGPSANSVQRGAEKETDATVSQAEIYFSTREDRARHRPRTEL